jgi:hypothetical protein
MFPAEYRLPPPQRGDPPAGHFANVHIPASHPRYASLVEWTKTAEPKFWKFGKSSVGVEGIWIPHNAWDEGVSAMKKIAASATMTIDQLRGHYAKHGLANVPKQRDDDMHRNVS